MKHLALAVSDRERSRRFYETYFGFDAAPPRQYDDGVLMLYDAEGFALALGRRGARSGCRRSSTSASTSRAPPPSATSAPVSLRTGFRSSRSGTSPTT